MYKTFKSLQFKLKGGITMNTLRLLTAVCSFLMIISCGGKAAEIKNPAILGKWEDAAQVISFSADGKVCLTEKTNQALSTGSFIFIDENRLRVSFGGSTKDYEFSVSGDTLLVDSVNGNFAAEYTKLSTGESRNQKDA